MVLPEEETPAAQAEVNLSKTLGEVCEILRCTVLTGEQQMSMVVKNACGADLMSDVLAYAKPQCLLLTGLTNAQLVHTAEVADIKAIVMVRGKIPSQAVIDLACEKEIPLLATRMPLYQACGKLYRSGLICEYEEL